MKRMLQWLLSHPILISLGVLVVAIVVFAKQYPDTWSSWFADSPLTKTADSSTKAVKHAAASTPAGHSRPAAHDANTGAEPGEEIDEEPGTDPWHGYAHAQAETQQAEPMVAAQAAVGPIPATLDAAQADTLTAARQAFLQRDFATAEKAYRELIEEVPNAAGAHGELGNLYLAMGKPDASAEEYLAAGRALMMLSRPAEAAAVVPMIAAIDAEKARLLSREIDHAMGRQPPEPALSTTPAPFSAEQVSQLMSARTAFWQRDIETAVRQYQALIEQRPEAPDIEGELGNLYFAMRQAQLAAEHYAQAAHKLIKAGRHAEAAAMLPLVASLDTERAMALQQALTEGNQVRHE